ncbi:hypothetical protein BHE74_00018437 [Ensete ventricosum]|nr:hypothetical protein BHE74_00018437 [Ensete ventricosum]
MKGKESLKRVSILDWYLEEWTTLCTKGTMRTSIIGATRELDYLSAYIHLREPGKSEGKAEGAQLPKSKASIRKEVDSEEYHSVVEADLPNVKKKDANARQRIVGPWARHRYGTIEAGLLWSYRSLALMEGECWS